MKMKFFLVTIIVIINASTLTAKPVENKIDNDFFGELQLFAKTDGLRKMPSIKTILRKYVESKFPHIERHQQTKILKTMIQTIKEKLLKEMMKENLKSPWLGKDDMLARMLK